MQTPRFDAFTTQAKFRDEADLVAELTGLAALDKHTRARIGAEAARLVREVRAGSAPNLMEKFLAEYSLSSDEGVALMCLAEAMLRVPDAETIDALIEDKIAPSDWASHLGEAHSPLVNASTWALMLTGRVLEDRQPGLAGRLHDLVRRLGEPVIRLAVGQAMKEMGRQFVLGETIGAARKRAAAQEAKGYTYSYDMLGEAAMTAADAAAYARSYRDAIAVIAAAGKGGSMRDNPGISVKLSALHPRYEVAQEGRVLAELVPVVTDLARRAAAAGIGLNIDAEEQARLVLSLKVTQAVLKDPALAGWDGLGTVVQSYGKRAGLVLDWLHQLAEFHHRQLTVRLVKGAYWDAEMKLAQVEGLADFSLFTTKPATDVCYIACARKLIGYGDRLYPQFATHNAHTVAAIRDMAGATDYEFQRLHGMGEGLFDIVNREAGGRCRIYAPVGAHRDLLAYLVRRLLENGANSSFVHQIVDPAIPAEVIAADPFKQVKRVGRSPALLAPAALFGADRVNSTGFDLTDQDTLAEIDRARDLTIADAEPVICGQASGHARPVRNPATGDAVASVTEADAACVAAALNAARAWEAGPQERADILCRAADLYQASSGPFFAVLAQEAGKTLADAVAELREAVDFLRYYAGHCTQLQAGALGTFAAISPWNFPLAIFTGQIAGALAAGNAVIAKPAEQTPLVAAMAVRLLHEAGVPRHALQLLPGDGPTVGAALTADPRLCGVVFTGSTETAQIINRAMAENLAPGAPLIAETGGLNAMIVDSTALPEQAVRDIVNSAFRSAGQRCSALRCLYVQQDVAAGLTEMLKGAMDELQLGDPRLLSTDVGPVIDAEARDGILAYLKANRARILHSIATPAEGLFVAPTLIGIGGIEELEHEVFGPVLHLATFRGDRIDRVIEAINARGYGLTFGLHSRIDGRVQHVSDTVRAGNLYVNRNQIGAVVGSQPFGGEGLSGTGPKAGGPYYVRRFAQPGRPTAPAATRTDAADPAAIAAELRAAVATRLDATAMPGPTGELNSLGHWTRPPVLCLGPGAQALQAQVRAVRDLQGHAVAVAGRLEPDNLAGLEGFSSVLWWGDNDTARAYARALAGHDGPILPLITGLPDFAHAVHERHLCVDTTAAGGNATLMAASGQ